jgi:hypothetical protein
MPWCGSRRSVGPLEVSAVAVGQSFRLEDGDSVCGVSVIQPARTLCRHPRTGAVFEGFTAA